MRNPMQAIDEARRLVVKIGSSLLLQDDALNHAWLAAMAGDLAKLNKSGKKLIVVSSGAVSLGCAALGLKRTQLTLEESQAAAATGQIELAQGWQAALAEQGLAAAQILLTAEDTEQRRRYLNARQTLTTLLAHGAVPVINENDTVATQELRYGDNDRLAARVAAMVSADCLVCYPILTGYMMPIRRKMKMPISSRKCRILTPRLKPWPAAPAQATAQAAW